jgi:hypothetical protein
VTPGFNNSIWQPHDGPDFDPVGNSIAKSAKKTLRALRKENAINLFSEILVAMIEKIMEQSVSPVQNDSSLPAGRFE